MDGLCLLGIWGIPLQYEGFQDLKDMGISV